MSFERAVASTTSHSWLRRNLRGVVMVFCAFLMPVALMIDKVESALE